MWESLETLIEAAEQGDANAQTELADRYRDGKGIDQDYTKAVEWYRKAAEQGVAKAQCFLGAFYYDGIVVKQDYVKAFDWYEKSAEQGYEPAQVHLSWFGVPVEWYRKADEQDHESVVDLQKKAPVQRFYNSIKNNNTEEVLKIINSGVNLNLSLDIPSEYTPLMVAAQYDSKEVAELLIEHGAEVNLAPIVLDDGCQFFPLSAAAEWNSKNVAELLINNGAWLDAWDALDRDDYDIDEFHRPIDFAMINNSKDVVEVFLNHGYKFDSVNFYEEDEDGSYGGYNDPIAYAEEHNFTELAELLKKRLKKS